MARPRAIRPVRGKKAFIHLCIVADSGWGKTVFAGSADRVLFIVCDPEGTVSAASMGSSADEWEIKKLADLEEAYQYLKTEGHKEYDWAIIDTVGGAQRILQRSALDASYREKPGVRDPDVPSMDVHQKAQIQTVRFVMQFNDLPMNICYTAHPMLMEDGDGEPKILPYVHGGKGEVAQSVLGHMNVAGYGVMKEVDGKTVRRLYFSQRGAYKGKDRFHKLGAYRDNLTLAQLTEIITAPAAKKTAAPTRRRVAKKAE